MKTKIEEHFDVNRIIGIKVVDKRESSYKWLPRKQKTFFFGLYKRDSWHSEGFYENGSYYEGYMGESWDTISHTKEELIEYGFIVDENNVVWSKPYATVYLEHECKVNKYFNTFDETIEWCEMVKSTSGKTFEFIRYEN